VNWVPTFGTLLLGDLTKKFSPVPVTLGFPREQVSESGAGQRNKTQNAAMQQGDSDATLLHATDGRGLGLWSDERHGSGGWPQSQQRGQWSGNQVLHPDGQELHQQQHF